MKTETWLMSFMKRQLWQGMVEKKPSLNEFKRISHLRCMFKIRMVFLSIQIFINCILCVLQGIIKLEHPCIHVDFPIVICEAWQNGILEKPLCQLRPVVYSRSLTTFWKSWFPDISEFLMQRGWCCVLSLCMWSVLAYMLLRHILGNWW